MTKQVNKNLTGTIYEKQTYKSIDEFFDGEIKRSIKEAARSPDREWEAFFQGEEAALIRTQTFLKKLKEKTGA